tara:strand:- start:60 stop:251 length:192 start_codon:yes stop_codon:yes gene_type:complete
MKNFNNNQKLILIGIAVVVLMFLVYNLFLSPHARCVSGMINEYDHVTKDWAKVRCTLLLGGGD